MGAQRPCYILVGPEDEDRIRQIESASAPRLDYRLVANILDAKVVECSPPSTAFRGHKILRQLRSLAGNFRAALLLVRHIPDGGSIYSTGETWGLPVALVGAILRQRRFSHVIYVHRVFSPTWLRFLSATRKYLAVDGWICVTSYQAQLLRKALGPVGAAVAVVSQGVDACFFDPAQAVPAPDRRYILSVGVEMRNYELLFDAVRALDIDVVVKASSAWMTGSRSQPTAIPANVKLITQRLSYVELRNLYAGAALVVAPLYDTPQAAGITTILEAMAMEKPVIATRSKGLPDILVHDLTGTIAEPSVEALADTIAELLIAQQRRATLPDAAKRAVVAQVTIEEHAKQVADFLILTSQKRKKK